MAVKYLSGNRLWGTNAERLAMTTTSATPQTSWKELDSVTLGSAGADLDTFTVGGNFTAKDNLMILAHLIPDGTCACDLSFNDDDDDENYSARRSNNGASDSELVDKDVVDLRYNSNEETFIVITIKNTADKEKLCIANIATAVGGSASSSAPNRSEVRFKWANTSDQITRVRFNKGSFTNYASGSQLVVLGCDDDEADGGGTTNFWQELSSTKLDEAGHISSGTITDKKYIFGDFYATGADNGGSRPRLRFNDDTDANYSTNFSNNGTAETPSTSYESLYVSESDINEGCFATFIIVNMSDKVKLVIYQSNRHSSSGAGTVPNRFVGTGKWSDTSDPITEIDVRGSNNTGSDTVYAFDSGTILRIWGGTPT